MGESVHFSRFIGLQIPKETKDKLDYARQMNLPSMYVHAGPLGDLPFWVVPKEAKSVCAMSYSRWDGHGGGADLFDFHQDPFSMQHQIAAIAHDVSLLKEVKQILDGMNLEYENIVHVLGWTDTWPEGDEKGDAPEVNESCLVISRGPWPDVYSDENELASNAYWDQVQLPPEPIELPYGKVTIEGYPAIPIQ